MHPKFCSSLASLLIILSYITASAQPSKDSLIVRKGKEYAVHQYELATEGTHHLYNGSQYIAYQPLGEEHPYFLTDEWTSCDIKYDGEWYKEVPLLYDIERGTLVASYYYKGVKMELIQNRINEFTIGSHHFVNVSSTTDSLTMKAGLYELLYEGNTPVLARRTKKLLQQLDGGQELRKFIETPHYFISVNGRFYRISSKRDLLGSFDSKQKKELRTYIRESGLQVGSLELLMVGVAKHYDTLKP